MLATDLAMGMESPSGTGASASSCPRAHHRVCSCHPASERADSHASGLIRSYLWIWSTHHRHLLESWPVLRSRVSSSIRWDAAVSSREHAGSPGAASRSRWQPARGVCGQHPQLPPLPTARAVPMAGQRYRETAPGQSPLASSGRWSGSCALERLEPEASSAGVHPSAASPTCAGADGIWHFSQSTSLACAPVPRAAGALSSRLAGALRSQRAYKSESGDDQTVRHLGSVCHLARTGNGLTPFCQPLGIPLLGQACFSEWSLMAFFSGCSSISYGFRNQLLSIRSSIV